MIGQYHYDIELLGERFESQEAYGFLHGMGIVDCAKVCPTNAKIVKAAAILDQPFGRLSRGAKAGSPGLWGSGSLAGSDRSCCYLEELMWCTYGVKRPCLQNEDGDDSTDEHRTSC